MTLKLQNFSFRDFRSYEAFALDGLGSLTVLVGPNAVGKTNVIEGVQLMTALSSFRHATSEQMIRRGASSARIEATFGDGNRLLDMQLCIEERARKYRLNGKPKRPRDLKGLAPSVVFTPDDLDLVKGPMSVRRHALDALGSQVNANYYTIAKDYERVVRHKNKLLKEEASDVLLDSIDEMLVTCGAQLTCYRIALFERLKPWIQANYQRICSSRESLECGYRPSWLAPDEPSIESYTRDLAREMLSRALPARRGEERARRRAVVGPHADAVTFEIDGMDAALYGSQGQQRSVVLSCKIAEANVVEELLDQKPLLLLDDVMSELDGARREALIEYIAGDVQTFVTTANLAYFDQEMLNHADIIQLPLDGSF